jgi:hypothetical protein
MKQFKQFTFIIIVALIWSCSNDDDTTMNNPPIYENRIDIGDYSFYFPDDFQLEVLQGIDSYIGRINGNESSLFFDYGWYTSPVGNLPANEYTVTEDNLNGHFRQIVKPVDAIANYTRIHLYKISDQQSSPNGYNSLTILADNLSVAQQEVIIDVFNTVQIME